MKSLRVKIALAMLIFMFFGIFAGVYRLNCDKEGKRLYAQGMEFYQKRNYPDAYYNFKQIERFSSVYEPALLKQFQCANYLSDKKTARIKLQELIKKSKNPYLKPYLLYSEVSLAQDTESLPERDILTRYKYIYNNYKENNFAYASAYKIAKLEAPKKGQHQYAKDKFIEYIEYAPTGKFALDSLEELEKLESLDASSINFTKDDYEKIAKTYLSNKEYTKALRYYKKTVFSKNWADIARCYRGLNDSISEQNTILRALDLKTSEVSEKEIDLAIDRLVVITRSNKLQTLQNLYTKYPHSYIMPTVAYKLAESSTSIRAIKLYEYVVNKYPNSIWASNALWEVFWYNYKLQRYIICEQAAKMHMDLYYDTQDAPRIAYWWGRTLLNEKKPQQAKEVFYDVIKKYPLSYYAFLSTRQLKISKAGKMIVKKPIAEYSINSINKNIFKDKLLLFLADNNDYQTIDELKIDDVFVKSWIAHKKGNYPASIKGAKDELSTYKELDFSNPVLKLAYPVLYSEEINFYAKENKQSPYLFISLIREESHFDKNAKSRVGATGLSQVMPATANFIEKRTVSNETLLDEDENIKIGLKYFTYLTKYFDNNEYLAILSYNAGPGNITKWIQDPKIENNEIDVFVENIPYLETKNYIKKILSSYWTYVNIYSPKYK